MVQEHSDLQERFDSFSHYYLYGATPAALDAKHFIEKNGKKCSGIVDSDKDKQGSTLYDLPVIAPSNLLSENNGEVGIIVVSAYQKDISNFLTEQGVSPGRIFPYLDGMFFPTYGRHYNDDKWLDRVQEGLTSDEERMYFLSWRAFKVSGNISDLAPMISINQQYDHKTWVASVPTGGRALDIGAYDGATSVNLALTKKFKEIVAFEPFDANFELLENTTKHYDGPANIVPEKKAIGAAREVILLDQSAETSRASLSVQSPPNTDGYKQRIDVWSLDALDYDEVSLIKVDIEGYELDFLSGAINTLQSCQPHLAISAYHHASHPAAIAKFLYENFDNVSIRVGHHPLAIYELEYYVSFDRCGSKGA